MTGMEVKRVRMVDKNGENLDTIPTVATPSTTSVITIANGQSVSSEIDLGGAMVIAISMPDAFTGTTITFQGSRMKGGTYKDIFSANVEVSSAVVAGKMISLDQIMPALYPYQYIKIRSGTSGSPTAEAAERKLYVIMK